MKRLILWSIRFYQRYFYFLLGLPAGRQACRFSPTCSEYMYRGVVRYGILHGLSLGFQRILRCHPWNPGGHDPVP